MLLATNFTKMQDRMQFKASESSPFPTNDYTLGLYVFSNFSYLEFGRTKCLFVASMLVIVCDRYVAIQQGMLQLRTYTQLFAMRLAVNNA